MGPEARFSKRVREGLVKAGCDVERIENRVNLGISDMLVGAGSRFVALELKVVSAGLAVGLRPHQIAFMARHAAKGRPCFVLVLDEGNSRRPSSVCLYHGEAAVQLASEGLRLEPLKRWPNIRMPWEELAQWLADSP
jgi:hypothetical protein